MIQPLVIAHRGASAYLPENTLEAFQMAFDRFHADMIEFDVRLARDGVPIIMHDATLERTTNGRGYVSRYSVKELKQFEIDCHPAATILGEPSASVSRRGSPTGRRLRREGEGPRMTCRIPTLEEVFQAFPGRQFAVEIKDHSSECVKKSMDLVQKYGLNKKVIVGSKHDLVFSEMRKRYPGTRRFLSQCALLCLVADFKRGAKPKEKDPLSVASIPTERLRFRLDAKAFIDFLHERGVAVFFWTINDASVMKSLSEKGVEGMITDHPGLLNQVLGRSGTGPTAA